MLAIDDMWTYGMKLGVRVDFRRLQEKSRKTLPYNLPKKSNVGGKNSEMNPHSCHLRAILTTFRHTMHIIHIYI